MRKELKKMIEEYLSKDVRLTFYERLQYQMECEKMFESLSFAERYVQTFRYILNKISVPVHDGEIIVGSLYEELPTEQQIRYVNELSQKWWSKCPEDIQKEALWTYNFAWLRRRAPWFYSFGHLAFDWEEIVLQGLGGLRSKAMTVLSSGKFDGDEDKTSFLRGVILCYDAYSDYILRYADAVKDDAMAESLRHIATQAPRTFYEALQLLWLIEMPAAKVAGCGVFCLGRMDQYLFPFYRRDIDSGILTEELAMELVEEFFYKNNEMMSLTDHMSDDADGTSETLEVIFDDPNYVIIGGLLKEGVSGVNDLSMIMVKANKNLGLKNPFMVVRYHDGIDKNFWLEVCDAMRKNTTLVLYNDDTMIKALKSYGVHEPEVYDYGFFGCNDPLIPAYEGGLRQLWFNLAKPLELALNGGEFPMFPRGDSPMERCQFSTWDRMTGLMTGPYYGIKTKLPREMTSMDDIMDAFRAQVRFLLNDYKEGIKRDLVLEKEYNKGHIRIEDCFLKGTVENAVNWNGGGTKYHKYIVQGSGLATVVDSLYAVEELVFNKKEYTLDEFICIVSSGFKGYEKLQNRLKYKVKKFGNDYPEVDKYATSVVDIFYEELMKLNEDKDCLYDFWPTLSSDRAFTIMGGSVGATPDGRGEREPLSENQSPVEGADVNGITALLNSAARIPYHKVSGGPLNIKIHPNVTKGEEGLMCFSSLLLSYMQNGGMQAQVNILDKDMLVAAQKEPLKHKGLCVRVTGYSAFFVQMGKKAQDELIKRTELQ